jgi:hypothetical protein
VGETVAPALDGRPIQRWRVEAAEVAGPSPNAWTLSPVCAEAKQSLVIGAARWKTRPAIAWAANLKRRLMRHSGLRRTPGSLLPSLRVRPQRGSADKREYRHPHPHQARIKRAFFCAIWYLKYKIQKRALRAEQRACWSAVVLGSWLAQGMSGRVRPFE